MKNIKNIAFAITITLFAVSCKKETTPEPKEVTTAKTEIAAENLETASFTIEGMTCAMGCAKVIENKLGGLDGVQKATVDFDKKEATIEYDAQVQTIETLSKTVEEVADGKTYKVKDAKNI